MATLKILLYKSKKLKDKTHPIVLRLTKGNQRKYISLGYSCFEKQWDFVNAKFRRSVPNYKKLNILLEKIEIRAKEILIDFESEQILHRNNHPLFG